MKLQRKLFGLLLSVVTLCTMGIGAAAAGGPDLTKTGSITISMQQGETAISGGTLTIYQVATVQEEEDGGSVSYVPTSEFADYGQSLEEIQSAKLAKSLAQYAETAQLTGTKKTISQEGNISFSDLSVGLYLLVQEEAASGYSKAEPFLVTVPLLEDGTYLYDVDATPKMEVEKISESDSPSETTPPASQTPESPPASTTTPTTPSTPTDSTLPQTGQLNWPIPVLVIVGLALITTGCVLRSRKTKDNDEI